MFFCLVLAARVARAANLNGGAHGQVGRVDDVLGEFTGFGIYVLVAGAVAGLAAHAGFREGFLLVVEPGDVAAAAVLQPGALFPVVGMVGNPAARFEIVLGGEYV